MPSIGGRKKYPETIEENVKELEEVLRPKPTAPPTPTPTPHREEVELAKWWTELMNKKGVSISPNTMAELLRKYGLRTFSVGMSVLLTSLDIEAYIGGLKKLEESRVREFLDKYLSSVKDVIADVDRGKITREKALETIMDIVDSLSLKYLAGAPMPPQAPTPPKPTPLPKPVVERKPEEKPRIILSPREISEAVRDTIAFLPKEYRAIVEKIPRGPAGDPGVLLYQAYISETLRKLLGQEHPSLAEAIKLASKEISSEELMKYLANYVWYPISGMFCKLERKWSTRESRWVFTPKPVDVTKIIDGLIKAYRKAVAVKREVEKSSLSVIYERYIRPLRELRELQARLMTGSKRYAGLVGLMIVLARIGIVQGMTVDEADEIYRRVFGKPMPEEIRNILVRIGYLRQE